MASPVDVDFNKTPSETAAFPASTVFDDIVDLQWWIGLLELIVFFIGVPMNVSVLCLAYLTHRRLVLSSVQKRTITETLVVSMTSADLIFCSIHAPLMFLMFNRQIDLSPIPCLTLFAATHVSTVASSLSLLWLNVNKFLHIHRPLHYVLYVNRGRASGCVLLCWTASIGWGLLFVLGPFISYDSQCNIYLHHKSVYVVYAIVFFILPAIISLIISVYVAVIVVENKSTNSQSNFSHYRNLRFYTYRSHVRYPVKDNNNGTSTGDGPIRESRLSYFRVRANTTGKKKMNWNEDLSFAAPRRSLHASEANYRNYNRRKGFSPTYWPPPSTFLSSSPSSRRMAHIRRISFVFTTTLWSTLTVLPYRVAFIVSNLPTQTSDRIDQQPNHAATVVDFCLFSLMTLNAVGNPFITILTQRQYSVWLKQVWAKVMGESKENKGKCDKDGVIGNGYRRYSPTGADTTHVEL